MKSYWKKTQSRVETNFATASSEEKKVIYHHHAHVWGEIKKGDKEERGGLSKQFLRRGEKHKGRGGGEGANSGRTRPLGKNGKSSVRQRQKNLRKKKSLIEKTQRSSQQTVRGGGG